MNGEGEQRLLEAFQKLGYKRPRKTLRKLLKDLYKKGQFMYVVQPQYLSTEGYERGEREPLYMRLSRN